MYTFWFVGVFFVFIIAGCSFIFKLKSPHLISLNGLLYGFSTKTKNFSTAAFYLRFFVVVASIIFCWIYFKFKFNGKNKRKVGKISETQKKGSRKTNWPARHVELLQFSSLISCYLNMQEKNSTKILALLMNAHIHKFSYIFFRFFNFVLSLIWLLEPWVQFMICLVPLRSSYIFVRAVVMVWNWSVR